MGVACPHHRRGHRSHCRGQLVHTPPPVTSQVYTGRSWISAPSDMLSRSAELHMLPGTGYYNISIYMYRLGVLGNPALPTLEFDRTGTGETTFQVPFVPDPGKCMELVSWSYNPAEPQYTVTFTPETDLSVIVNFYTYTIFHTSRGITYP